MLPQTPQAAATASDEDLVRRFQQGDEQAFVFLVRRYKHRLTNFVFRHLGELDEAADIVQDTFIRVYCHRDSFRSGAKFTTWLFRIALNLSTSELRRQTRRRRLIQNGSLRDYAIATPDSDPLDQTRRPDRLTESVLTFELVQRALLLLSPPLREALILREIEDMSYEEIVEITGVELGTVKSRINRGRSQLQRHLRQAYHEERVGYDA